MTHGLESVFRLFQEAVHAEPHGERQEEGDEKLEAGRVHGAQGVVQGVQVVGIMP